MKQTDFLQPFLKESKKTLQRYVGPLSFDNQRFNLFLVGVVLFLWFILGTIFSNTVPPAKNNENKLVRVQVINSKAQEKTTYYTLQGSLEALNKVTLKAETAGIVKSIPAEKGETLLKGQDILNLSFASRLSTLREAKAVVEQRLLDYNNAKKLQSNKFKSKTAVAEAKSQLESAQAALEQIQTDIEFTKVRAPFDGRVDTRYVQLGDYVKTGDKLLDYVSLDPLLAVVFVSEKDIHRIQLGSQTKIHCSDNCLAGEVTFVSAIADSNTRTYRVEITINNTDAMLSDGLTASIQIPVDTSKAHLFSPAAIAMDHDGKPGIKTVDQDNKVAFHTIDILNHDDTGIWVRGLPDETKVITVGQYYVKAGDTVDPVVMNVTHDTTPEDKNVSDPTGH